MRIKYQLLILLFFIGTVVFSISKQAPETSFELSESVIKQAKEIAAKEFSNDLSKRRPEGLSKLDTEEDIRKAIDQSMKELGDDEREVQEKGLRKLRYLGKLAFDDIVEGLESEKKVVRKWCVVLLERRGSEAIPYLSEVLRTDSDKFIRSTATNELGGIFDSNAVPVLLEALNNDEDFFVKISAARALAYLKDKRAFEPLKKLIEDTEVDGQIREAAANAIFRIDEEEGSKVIQEAITKESEEYMRHNFNVVLESTSEHGYWPLNLLGLHQLTKDADTLAGENFSEKEIRLFLDNIDSSYWSVYSGTLHALAVLKVSDAVPEIIARGSRSSSFYQCLAQIGSPEAGDYLIKCIQSEDQDIRNMAIEGMGYGGKWAVPILVQLLDDMSFRRIHKGDIFPIDAFNGRWPDTHRAYDALYLCLSNHGLKGGMINLATGAKYNIDEEITRIKDWWKMYGEDFLQGKDVPTPNLKMVMLIS